MFLRSESLSPACAPDLGDIATYFFGGGPSAHMLDAIQAARAVLALLVAPRFASALHYYYKERQRTSCMRSGTRYATSGSSGLLIYASTRRHIVSRTDDS